MADLAVRCVLTVLHVCISLASGGSLVVALLQWTQNLNCLPPVTDGFGDPVLVENALSRACDMMTIASAVTCGLSLVMALTINCCWGIWSCSCIHQLVTLLICVTSIGSGAALTVDFVLWCSALENAVPSSGCADAAQVYDDWHKVSNMTVYYRKMEIQQGCQWAIVPAAFITVIAYSLVMKKNSQPIGNAVRLGGRYYILQEDESAPLFRSVDSLPSFVAVPPPYSPSSDHAQAVTTPQGDGTTENRA